MEISIVHAKILEDDSLCETIVVIDNHMTASARFADILLPETSYLEAEGSGGQFLCSRFSPLHDCNAKNDHTDVGSTQYL